MLRVTFLLSVLTVLLADNSTEFKVRERRNTRVYGRRPLDIPGLRMSNPPGHIDPDCRICGVSATSTLRRVINGQLVSPRNKYPWIMPITTKGRRGQFICAGALINKRFVLTAAHCVRDPAFKEFNKTCKRDNAVVSCYFHPEELLVGQSHTESLGSTVCRRIYVHPRYDYLNDVNDIALLELKWPVPQCNKYISPICLPQVRMSKMNEEVIVAGWGRWFRPYRLNEGPKRLREDRVREVDPFYCQMASNEGRSIGLADLLIYPEKIYCTMGAPRRNPSSCEVDTGSTVFASFNGVFYSLGVPSTHSDPNTCPNGVVSLASTYGYRAFIRRIAGELPSPPMIPRIVRFSHK